MLRATTILSASLALLALPRASDAQVCHAPEVAPAAAPERHGWVEVRGEAATVDAMITGHYEGVTLAGGWRWDRATVRVALPSYRIESEIRTLSGLGDASVDATATILRGDAIDAGLGLGLALPTGDRDDGLGMGHAMIVPALWTHARADRVAVDGSVLVGHMLGDDPHFHHHAPGITVNPMSPVEAGATLEVAVDLAPRWTPNLSAAIGVPLDDGGHTRAVVGAGVRWDVGRRWHVDGEILAPVVGDPFTVRATIGLTRWL
jgi:hypothetical protein